MHISKMLEAASLEEWRAWLRNNHTTEKEIWLVFHKQAVRQPALTYEAAVEEALCVGWIDSLIKKIDETSYARLFTPRSNNAKWSEANKARVRKLIAEERMTPAGLEKIGPGVLDTVNETPRYKQPVEVSPETMAAIQASPAAWENFSKLSPSMQKRYLLYIATAKKPETQQRRLAEIIGLLERNEPLGLKG